MIHKELNIIIIFIFISVFNSYVNAKIDEESINGDLNQILDKAEKLLDSNPDSCLFYSLNVLQAAEEENYTAEYNRATILVSNCYEKLNNFDQAKKSLNNAVRFNKNHDDNLNQIKLLIKLGDLNFRTGDYSSAFTSYNDGLEISYLISDRFSQAEILNNIGIVYKFKGEYSDALKYHFEALKIYEQLNDDVGIAASHGNIGNVYESLNDYDKALNNYLKAFNIYEKLKDDDKIANSLMNIGVVYFNIDKKSEALGNFLKAYEIASRTDNNLIQSYSLNNIAYVQNDLGNYSEAINYYNKAFQFSEKTGDKWGMANTLNDIASVYLLLGEIRVALNNVTDAFRIAENINAKDLMLESYRIYSDIYESDKNFAKSLEYYKLYKSMNDTLYAEENQKKIIEANIKYDTEKKEKEINELQITQQKRIILFTVITIVLLLIIAVINYALYLQKKNSNVFLNNVINALTHPFIVFDLINEKNEIFNKAASEANSPYVIYKKDSNQISHPYTMGKIVKTKKPAVIECDEFIEGEKKYFECFGFPIFNKKMEVEKIIEYAVDVTEKKEAVNKIKTAFERERELNELKSNFISSTSHEFRTPLATLFSSVELINHYEKTKSAEKKQYHLGRIKDIVTYMTKMLDNILTINKAEVDKIEFRPEIINIKSFCREILEDIIISASDKHLIDQSFIGDADKVFLDPNLLRQILTNLLSNAIKYSPNGGKILFETEVLDNSIIFTIRDEGIGIPKEDVKNLYQYFFRAKNSKTIAGTGLGLSIVKKSVEVHKGKIEVFTIEGEGTTFTVTLPTDKNLVEVTNVNKIISNNKNEENSFN